MTRTWSEWLPHTAGEPCPIPDAIAGEYKVIFNYGATVSPVVFDAVNFWEPSITHYRYLLPEPAEPVKNWESVAREWECIAGELAKELLDTTDNGLIYWEPITGRGDIEKMEMIERNRAALSTYEAMKK